MRRKESKKSRKKPCCRTGAVKRALFRLPAVMVVMAVMAVSSGCTRKEELVFSLQNEQPDTETPEEGAVSEPQAQGESAEQEETAVNTAVTGDAKTASVPDIAAATETDDQSDNQPEICVHVCGAVKNPGVYELPAGSRVYEAIQAAGGFSENAEESYVNQAQQLPDAVQLVIPTVDQVAVLEQPDGQADTGTKDEGTDRAAFRIGIISRNEQDDLIRTDVTGGSEEENTADDGKININTASESQLCDIPGIGAVRASAIAAYRQEHGAFETIEDIMKVNGIKQGTYDKIKDSIKVK